jgi:hypothetical protein
MKELLKHLPGRRLELGLTVLLAAGSLALTGLARDDPRTSAQLLLTTLELILPLALGIVAAGLLADDPALDLLLSAPQPAPRTLAQRLSIVLGCGLALSLTASWLADRWQIPLPILGVKQLLIWASPTLFLAGVAVAGSLLRGRMLDGLTAVLGAWGATLFSIPVVTQVCAQAPGEHCAAALLSPAMTHIWPLDPNWLLNRLIWSGLGLLLLGAGLLLAGDEERLVEATRIE